MKKNDWMDDLGDFLAAAIALLIMFMCVIAMMVMMTGK